MPTPNNSPRMSAKATAASLYPIALELSAPNDTSGVACAVLYHGLTSIKVVPDGYASARRGRETTTSLYRLDTQLKIEPSTNGGPDMRAPTSKRPTTSRNKRLT